MVSECFEIEKMKPELHSPGKASCSIGPQGAEPILCDCTVAQAGVIQCQGAIQLRRVAIDDKLQVVVFHLDWPSKHVIHFPS